MPQSGKIGGVHCPQYGSVSWCSVPHRKSRRWPPFLHRRNSEEFASSIARGTRPSDSGHAEQKARASAALRYAGFAVFEAALALAAKIAQRKDSKIVEPLHLLAAIVEDRESRLAQLLRDNGVTRQRVAQAFGAGAASG